ncbi:MAG: hypothetical protein AB1938_16530 [Myxococcota bacterium]
MATYTMYWPDWMCAAAREQGLDGQPLRLLWGGHNADSSFSRFKVGPGDTVVPVTSRDGVLYALAALDVTEKTDADAWLATHPGDAKLRMHGCGKQLLVGTPRAPLRFDRPFTPAQLETWRYDSGKTGRGLKHLDEKGRLTRILALQGVYRVSPKTAEMIAGVLAAASPPPPSPTEASALLARMREAPEDEATAHVLADAWQQQGEPRGELLALELALRTERDARKAADLDQRLAGLARKVKGLKTLPGGFPFRGAWGYRDHVELRVTDVALKSLAPRDALELAQGFLLVDDFSLVGLRASEAPPALEAVLQRLGAERSSHRFLTRAWGLKGGFTVERVEACLAAQPNLALVAQGPLRLPGEPWPVPLQAPALWAGPALESEVVVHVEQRRAELTLRAPSGSALADVALKTLEDGFARAGLPVHRRTLRRGRHGDMLPQAPRGR